MKYEIIISRKAEKDYSRSLINIPYKVIFSLESDQYKGKSLAGKLKGYYSLRLCPYRIIYEIKQKEVLVFIIRIGYRKDVYERLTV